MADFNPAAGWRDMTLGPDGIDVWLAFYHEIVDDRLLALLREPLNDAERRQQARFYFADDRKRFLVTRAMVRTLLSRYAPIAPADWMFSTNEYGRPEIANRHGAAGLCFNVSHTCGLIALAISRNRALGVDVEHIAGDPAPVDIAGRFFAPAEVAALAALPPELQHGRFFEYWTFKEAYIKARGMGLALPLDQFSFDFPDERTVRLALAAVLQDDARRWRFHQYRPAPEWLLAVCAGASGAGSPHVTVRSTVPTVADHVLKLAACRTSPAVMASP